MSFRSGVAVMTLAFVGSASCVQSDKQSTAQTQADAGEGAEKVSLQKKLGELRKAIFLQDWPIEGKIQGDVVRAVNCSSVFDILGGSYVLETPVQYLHELDGFAWNSALLPGISFVSEDGKFYNYPVKPGSVSGPDQWLYGLLSKSGTTVLAARMSRSSGKASSRDLFIPVTRELYETEKVRMGYPGPTRPKEVSNQDASPLKSEFLRLYAQLARRTLDLVFAYLADSIVKGISFEALNPKLLSPEGNPEDGWSKVDKDNRSQEVRLKSRVVRQADRIHMAGDICLGWTESQAKAFQKFLDLVKGVER